MAESISQAVILAGGKGLRLRPLTDDRPKALVRVAGLPILEHQLSWLAESGIREVVVSCGYKAEMIADYIAKRPTDDLRVSVVVEKEPLGRGGGLKFAASELAHLEAPFLSVNGDVISQFPVGDLLRQHRRIAALATVALVRFRSNWGVVEIDGPWVRRFEQSPILPHWGNAGIYCIEPAALGQFPDKGDLEDSTFPDMARAGCLGAFPWEGELLCIDSPKDVEVAQSALEVRSRAL